MSSMPGALSKLAPWALLLLLASTAIYSIFVSVVEPEGPPPPSVEDVLDLPDFQATDHLLVVDATGADFGQRLTLTSLQGLVNGNLSQVYLDREGELNDPDSLLSFLLIRYNLTHEIVTPGAFIEAYGDRASGLVVYDPDRPNTINVAGTLAGLEELLIVEPDRAEGLAASLGLEVVHDLRKGAWKELQQVQLYEYAFDEYYIKSQGHPLLGTRPTIDLMFDYGIAVKAFFYFLNPGPFSGPSQQALFEKFMAGSKPGVVLLGWFDQPTGVEENFAVQKASGYGHFFVGGARLPNFSLLTAYGRGELTEPQAVANPPPLPELEAKTYLSFAVTDGDNPEFFTRRGRDLWNQPQRGKLPLAWSVSPALAELAPPLLERAYLEASVNDSFIAGPSGLGYFYPGFLPEGHLEPLLGRSRDLMAQSHLDSVWLLNSFTTYETPYNRKDIQVYVDQIGPTGILLDYGDIPVTVPFWQESDTPIIRVFHLWGSVANLEAKLALALAENGPAATGQPYFVVVALMSISHDLDEIWEVYQGLDPNEVEVVALPAMFELVEDHWAGRLNYELQNNSMSNSLNYNWYDGSSWFDRSLEYCESGYTSDEICYLRYQEEKKYNDYIKLALFGLYVIGLLMVVDKFIIKSKRKLKLVHGDFTDKILDLLALTALWLVGLLLSDQLLRSNFWRYGWLGVGFGLAAALPAIQRYWPARYQFPLDWRQPLAGFWLFAGLGLFMLHPLGFVMALTGLVTIGRMIFSKKQFQPWLMIASFTLALTILSVTSAYDVTFFAAIGLYLIHERFDLGRQDKIAKVKTAIEDSRAELESVEKSNNPGHNSPLLAAAALALASLPWYLDRSFFWANHTQFHMEWLYGLGILIPLLAGLILYALSNWVAEEKLLPKEKPTPKAIQVLLKCKHLPYPLLTLLTGIAFFLAAAMVDVRFFGGTLLLAAEVCWLAAAWVALKPGRISEVPAPEKQENNHRDTETASSDNPNSSLCLCGRAQPSLRRILGFAVAGRSPVLRQSQTGCSSVVQNPSKFFFTVLALQAALALWLTIPPVFYAAFVWPWAPFWVNYLAYHQPLAMALTGLATLLLIGARRAVRLALARVKVAG